MCCVNVFQMFNLFVLIELLRFMYWSDWASGTTTRHGKIEYAWMDGSNRKIFIDTGLQWPNGLTIDHLTRTLYWCDAYLDKIEKIHLNKMHREVSFL